VRYTSPQKAFLRTRQPCLKADLFTLTLIGGTVVRLTTFDSNVVVGGHTFSAYGPAMSRTGLSYRNTVEVPEMNIRFLARVTDLILGLPIKRQVVTGVFDGATVQLDRIFMPTLGDVSLGTILMFIGRMSTAKVSAAGIDMTVKGDNVLMNQYMPKNDYQTNCLHTFCDVGCTLNPASFTISCTVGSSPTTIFLPWGSVPANPTFYTLGKVTMTSGATSGQVRTVKSADSSGVTLVFPLDGTPIAGDTFNILQGCDKTQPTCLSKFSNLQHFRGFPYIPPAETGV
jgi:uncharacterized phage protein (TIGR02218 family)